MRLLAETYSPQELNEKGFGIYADFRPTVEKWGEKGEVHCKDILALRKPPPVKKNVVAEVPDVPPVNNPETVPGLINEPASKKARHAPSDDYETVFEDNEWDASALEGLP